MILPTLMSSLEGTNSSSSPPPPPPALAPFTAASDQTQTPDQVFINMDLEYCTDDRCVWDVAQI